MDELEKFALWLKKKRDELQEKVQLIYRGEISWGMLNTRMAEYLGDLSWAQVQTVLIERRHRTVHLKYEHWFNERFLKGKSEIPKAPIKEIECMIEQRYPKEWKEWKEKLGDLEFKMKAIKRFEQSLVLYRDVLIELGRNFRSEMRGDSVKVMRESSTKAIVDRVKKRRRIIDEERE